METVLFTPALYPIVVFLSVIVAVVFSRGIVGYYKEHGRLDMIYRMRLGIAISFGLGVTPHAIWFGLAAYALTVDAWYLADWLHTNVTSITWLFRLAQITAALLHLSAVCTNKTLCYIILACVSFAILSTVIL